MKQALIVTNLIGFVGFLWNDIHVLQSLGYEVSFAADAKTIVGENHEEELKKAGISFYQVDFSSKNPLDKNNMRAYKEIKEILAEKHYDLIHCHTPIAGFIARLAARSFRKKGTKVLYTSHGLSFTHLSSKKQYIAYFNFEKFASKFTDVIITINNEDYENAKKFSCKDVRKINGVGVDTNAYHNITVDKEEYRKTLSVPSDKIMVLSVGELSSRKNHQIIIKALGLIANKQDYVYVICGREVAGSGMVEELKKLAKDCGVSLILLGHRSDIAEIMHVSDIGAIPSVREGLGLAGIESLAAEVPLVGTRVQGIQDYIVDGVDGYLCEPFDEVAYSEAIKKLSDPEVRKTMKGNCYEMAQQFDVKVSHKQMQDIYNSILAEV